MILPMYLFIRCSLSIGQSREAANICKLNDLPYPLEMLRSKDANNGLFNVLQRIVSSLSKRPSIISKKRLKFHRGENLTREMKVKNLLLREDNGW